MSKQARDFGSCGKAGEPLDAVEKLAKLECMETMHGPRKERLEMLCDKGVHDTCDGDGVRAPLHVGPHEAHDLCKAHVPLQAVPAAALHRHRPPRYGRAWGPTPAQPTQSGRVVKSLTRMHPNAHECVPNRTPIQLHTCGAHAHAHTR